jgi:low temperature requirement protein LtrA
VSVHDRYLFAHLPLAGGLVAVAVGLEHTITEARDGVNTTGTGWTLAGGLALYLAATLVLQSLTDRLRRGLLWPGLAIPAVLLVGALTSGLAMLVLLAAILVAGVIIGLGRRESGDLPTAEV